MTLLSTLTRTGLIPKYGNNSTKRACVIPCHYRDLKTKMSANSLSRKDKVSSTVAPQKGRFSTNILGDNMSSECFTPKVKFYTLRERGPKAGSHKEWLQWEETHTFL